ncbi:MAG: thrombospondin type 3 repeat-containing protein, partial [Duncaniella sp.]|nr:thrombospondin type 3 repeat-containing protein [Duncaniella sp.]
GGKPASFHHSVIAHVQNRSPRFNGARYESTNYDKTLYPNTVLAENVDFRNNLLYNWGNGAGSYGGPGGGQINIVNNYYKAGPGTKNKTNVTQVSVGNSGNSTNANLTGYASRYYVAGNYVTAAGDAAESYDWKGVSYDGGLSTINGERYIPDAKHLYGENADYVKNTSGVDCIRLRLDEPTITGEVTTHSAEQAYNKILKYAGASLFRDAVDKRVMEEARTGTVTYNGDVPYVDANGKTYAKSGTKGIVDWVNDPASATQNPGVPSFPVIKQESRPDNFDTDRDGMPDAWETANGLDPNDPDDGNLYTLDPRGWYTNFEVYANGIVEHMIKDQNADAIEAVDEYYPVANHSSSIADVE